MSEAGVRPGRGLFRWRSYTPLVVLAPILGATTAAPTPTGGWRWLGAWIGAAVLLAVLGLTLRALAIGFARPGTSGRATDVLRADSLTTDGVYSFVRHPMYLGNALLWLSVAASTGRPSLIVFTVAAFFLIHRPIVAAEDRYLRDRFGTLHTTWAERTPALLPRAAKWVRPSDPFRTEALLRRDYHAVFALVAATWSVSAARSVGVEGVLRPSAGSWLYLATGAGFFAVMHVHKSRSRQQRTAPP